MTPRVTKLVPAIALALTCSLAAFGVGVASSQPTPEPSVADGPAALALTASGGTVQLTSSQAEIAEENAEPLDPDDATFASNVDLTEAEVVERSEEVGESYEIGESVSLEDLEFLRIYAFSAEEPQSGSAVAVVHTDDSGELTSAQTFPFNATRTVFGTKANITGSITANVGSGISSSWSVTWTAKRVSGIVTTKIKSQAHVYAYGLTSVSPYVGLIYESHPSATSTAQSMGFSRTANFTGITYYMTVDAVSTFYSAAGSFQISGF